TRKENAGETFCNSGCKSAACRPRFIPRQTSQNTSDPNTQATVLRVVTASKTEKLKKTAKCSSSTGTARKAVMSHTPVRSASASQTPATNTSAWNATNTSTPRYFPASRLQRGTGLASTTAADPGSRNVGKKPAVQTSASSTPPVSAISPSRSICR